MNTHRLPGSPTPPTRAPARRYLLQEARHRARAEVGCPEIRVAGQRHGSACDAVTMHSFLAPIAPPGVPRWSFLWTTVTLVHLLLWVGAIVYGAMSVSLAYEEDDFHAIAVFALVATSVTVGFAALAALFNMWEEDGMGTGSALGYVAVVTSALAAGGSLLLLVDVMVLRTIERNASLATTETPTANEQYNTQVQALLTVMAAVVLMRHEMAALARPREGGVFVQTA